MEINKDSDSVFVALKKAQTGKAMEYNLLVPEGTVRVLGDRSSCYQLFRSAQPLRGN